MERLGLAGLLAVLTWPLCGSLFACGCTWLWLGGSSRCNVFAVQAPHCPWCAHAWVAGLALLSAGLVAMTLAGVPAQIRAKSVTRRYLQGLAAVASYTLLLIAIAWASAKLTAYPLGPMSPGVIPAAGGHAIVTTPPRRGAAIAATEPALLLRRHEC